MLISKKKYQEAQNLLDNLENKYQSLELDIEDKNTLISSLKQEVIDNKSCNEDLKIEINKLKKDYTELEKEYNLLYNKSLKTYNKLHKREDKRDKKYQTILDKLTQLEYNFVDSNKKYEKIYKHLIVEKLATIISENQISLKKHIEDYISGIKNFTENKFLHITSYLKDIKIRYDEGSRFGEKYEKLNDKLLDLQSEIGKVGKDSLSTKFRMDIQSWIKNCLQEEIQNIEISREEKPHKQHIRITDNLDIESFKNNLQTDMRDILSQKTLEERDLRMFDNFYNSVEKSVNVDQNKDIKRLSNVLKKSIVAILNTKPDEISFDSEKECFNFIDVNEKEIKKNKISGLLNVKDKVSKKSSFQDSISLELKNILKGELSLFPHDLEFLQNNLNKLVKDNKIEKYFKN